MSIEWGEKMMIGNKLIDHQHYGLVFRYNKLVENHQRGTCSRSYIGFLLDDLVAYTEYHFGCEQQLQRAVRYPDYFQHRIKHVNFVKKIKKFQKKFSEGEIIAKDLVDFLKNWIVNHIMKEDTRLASHIRKNFKQKKVDKIMKGIERKVSDLRTFKRRKSSTGLISVQTKGVRDHLKEIIKDERNDKDFHKKSGLNQLQKRGDKILRWIFCGCCLCLDRTYWNLSLVILFLSIFILVTSNLLTFIISVLSSELFMNVLGSSSGPLKNQSFLSFLFSFVSSFLGTFFIIFFGILSFLVLFLVLIFGFRYFLTIISGEINRLASFNLTQESKIDRLRLFNFRDFRKIRKSFYRLYIGLENYMKYVPFEILQSISRENELIRLGLDTRYVTVLFNDIENFTSLCEELDASSLVIFIDKFFNIQDEIVWKHQGIILSMTGDGIFAVWNSPKWILDHEQHAVECALELAQKIDEEFNNTQYHHHHHHHQKEEEEEFDDYIAHKKMKNNDLEEHELVPVSLSPPSSIDSISSTSTTSNQIFYLKQSEEEEKEEQQQQQDEENEEQQKQQKEEINLEQQQEEEQEQEEQEEQEQEEEEQEEVGKEIDISTSITSLSSVPFSSCSSLEAEGRRNKRVSLPNSFKEKGLFVRFGINSSTCLLGNVGSSYRMIFTGLGDGINTASRLEGLNKFYNTQILISQNTYEAIQYEKKFLLRYIDEVKLKGKNESISVYQVLRQKLIKKSKKNGENDKEGVENKEEEEEEFYYDEDERRREELLCKLSMEFKEIQKDEKHKFQCERLVDEMIEISEADKPSVLLKKRCFEMNFESVEMKEK